MGTDPLSPWVTGRMESQEVLSLLPVAGAKAKQTILGKTFFFF